MAARARSASRGGEAAEAGEAGDEEDQHRDDAESVLVVAW